MNGINRSGVTFNTKKIINKNTMMKINLMLIAVILCLQASAQSYKKIHDKAILVDTHNDILMRSVDLGVVFDQDLTGKTHSDLARWKKAA